MFRVGEGAGKLTEYGENRAEKTGLPLFPGGVVAISQGIANNTLAPHFHSTYTTQITQTFAATEQPQRSLNTAPITARSPQCLPAAV